MHGTVEYSTAYKMASLIITIFIFLIGIFIVFCINQVLFGISLLIIDAPFIIWLIHIFTFRLIFDTEKIIIKSVFRHKKYKTDDIVAYHFNKISYYGNTLMIKTKNGKIFIPSDCEHIDDFRNFLIKYCPIYVIKK